MNIQTKFEIGQEVFVINSEKIVKGEIYVIDVKVVKDEGIEILYNICDCDEDDMIYNVNEKDIFENKETLINYINATF